MADDIVERSVGYALRIIKLYQAVSQDGTGKILGKQLLRAGTSIGANIHEAQAAQSKADFIAKMSIAHKELRETSYWLRLFKEAQIISANAIADLTDETEQLIKIISAILLSAKRGQKR